MRKVRVSRMREIYAQTVLIFQITYVSMFMYACVYVCVYYICMYVRMYVCMYVRMCSNSTKQHNYVSKINITKTSILFPTYICSLRKVIAMNSYYLPLKPNNTRYFLVVSDLFVWVGSEFFNFK